MLPVNSNPNKSSNNVSEVEQSLINDSNKSLIIPLNKQHSYPKKPKKRPSSSGQKNYTPS